ncbi:AraC family transcriptional regulator [Pelagicoccus mobilis]|uniref:AraC family transcriptional regulator n=1 Tax=Pelagicoccus mobilis TaxID=415221 RepID=A0A934S869_9BACT|nr:AraC family transcriptional regulator [Pelagicoccus mobilis]MBK1880623.1 AraC family transcriptional regulator [Pelagicoccus mobilis]
MPNAQPDNDRIERQAKPPCLLDHPFQLQFLKDQPVMRSFFELFEYHPSAYFYAKDKDHRYIYVNGLILRDVFGLDSLDKIVGKTDLDFQLPVMARAYHAEDKRVMDGGKTIAEEVWLVPHVKGTPKWYVSTKTPFCDQSGEVLGIIGCMYPLETQSARQAYFAELAPAVAHIEKHFREEISISALAEMSKLSSTQFNFRFRTLLRLSPSEYILKLRIEAAQHLLNSSEKSIADIGFEIGFYDQSHFTKRFRKATGITPLAYRKQRR